MHFHWFHVYYLRLSVRGILDLIISARVTLFCIPLISQWREHFIWDLTIIWLKIYYLHFVYICILHRYSIIGGTYVCIMYVYTIRHHMMMITTTTMLRDFLNFFISSSQNIKRNDAINWTWPSSKTSSSSRSLATWNSALPEIFELLPALHLQLN